MGAAPGGMSGDQDSGMEGSAPEAGNHGTSNHEGSRVLQNGGGGEGTMQHQRKAVRSVKAGAGSGAPASQDRARQDSMQVHMPDVARIFFDRDSAGFCGADRPLMERSYVNRAFGVCATGKTGVIKRPRSPDASDEKDVKHLRLQFGPKCFSGYIVAIRESGCLLVKVRPSGQCTKPVHLTSERARSCNEATLCYRRTLSGDRHRSCMRERCTGARRPSGVPALGQGHR